MTPISVPARSGFASASLRLMMCLFVTALGLSACSDSGAEGTEGDAIAATKEVAEVEGDEEGGPEDDADTSDSDTKDGDTTDSDTSEEPSAPEAGDTPDAPATTFPDDEPRRPPGTINDLDDLIGNESEDGLASSSSGSLIERFVRALLADTGGLAVSESDARCAGERISGELSATSFELLVVNLETLNEIEDGRQFTDAELLVISEGMADCIDFRPIVDEIVGDDANIGGLVDCLAVRLDVDAVEALLLFELLGENGDRPTSLLVLSGLDLCPTEARAVIDATILREFLLDDAPQIEACLADIDNAELRPFFETRELGELIGILREQCLF